MSIPNVVTSAGSAPSAGPAPSRAEDRARIAELAAEFESLLLSGMLREMRSAGRWNTGEGGETLGADSYSQTMDVELARYLARNGGIGLSQRLLGAFDALARVADAAAPALSRAGGAPAATAAAPAAAPASAPAARIGWNGLRLDPPAYGQSRAEWAGFNNDRALSGGDNKSVKDAFFRWTYGLSFNPDGKTKEELGAYLRDNVQSAREYGLNILDVRGDKILIETKERGPEWVDIVEKAGGPGARWQWLCEYDNGVATGGGSLGEALMALRNAPGGEERARFFMTNSRLVGDALESALRTETAAALRGEPMAVAVTASAGATVPAPVGTAGTAAAAAPAALSPALEALRAAVTSAYGWRQDPITGATRFHRGVDLRAAEGDQVTTTGAGRVVFSGTQGSYGRTVVVEHANGLSTRYAHLSATLVRVGDQVQQGQAIGLAGRTGRATGTHVHYEVLQDGRPVNPLQF